MKFTWRGKQILRNTGETVERLAAVKERTVRAGLESEHWNVALQVLEQTRRRISGGDLMERLLDAWEEGWKTVRQAGAEKECRRCLNELLKVIAWARDLWRLEERGRYKDKHEVRVPDRGRINKLSIASVLCGETVRAYLRARAEEECGGVSWADRKPEHLKLNAMVRNARDMLRDRVWEHVYKPVGLLPPPKLEEFMTFDLLREVESEPEPLTAEEFTRMVEAARVMEASDLVEEQEVALANRLMRQTGMRPASIELARDDWMEKRHDGWWLVLRNVKSNTRKYEVPISDALALALKRGRVDGPHPSNPFLILPNGTPAARAKVVDELHNKFVKGVLGLVGRGQGTYRLRDTAAAICRTCFSIDVAVELLGHEDARTTRKHYARVRINVNELMKGELGAAGRLMVTA